jgi:peptide/nickel transport system permease protein/oligopeptide transport system permease protein
MRAYLLRRLVTAVPTLLAVTLLVFLVMRLIPGDPAVIMAGELADAATLNAIRHKWGLDRPLPVQYGIFLANLVRGDLGVSLRTGLPVLAEILRRYEVTLVLALLGAAVAVTTGLLLGILGATRAYTVWDYAGTVLALLGISTPVFWSGMLLILLFSVKLRWLPSGGTGSIQHFILPALSLGLFAAGVIARQTRSSLLEVLNQDYIRTARAKGLPGRLVVVRHALRNALIPVVTVIGIQFGRMLGGAILTETVFSLPGIGSFLVLAISTRDYPVVQGIVLVFAVSFVAINLAVDLSYALLDPRVRQT